MPWAVRRRSDGKYLKRTTSSRVLVDAIEQASTWSAKSAAKASARAAMSVLSTAAGGQWQPVEVEFVETCIAETGVVEVCRLGIEFVETCIAETGVVEVCRLGIDPSKSYKVIVETISKPQRAGFRMADSPQGALDVD